MSTQRMNINNAFNLNKLYNSLKYSLNLRLMLDVATTSHTVKSGKSANSFSKISFKLTSHKSTSNHWSSVWSPQYIFWLVLRPH